VKLLAEGRASEILALDDDRVLRRFRAGGDPEREARVMQYAFERGYPVPRVFEVRQNGLVLERVHGHSMKTEGFRRPERMEDLAELLADLHERLHRIPGEREGVLLHLDLHPENVLMGPGGPVVVDWANARDGPAELDPALTWVILMTSGGEVGRAFAELFARHIDVQSALEEAAAFRLADRNVTEAERAAVRELVTTIS
jgi:aminoglycoside phosphotransferase (APT) family kinase protein